MAQNKIALVCAAAVLVSIASSLAEQIPTGYEFPEADHLLSLPGERIDKRDWPFRRLLPHNPILIYHQSIRQPRYLGQASSSSNEPVSNIPRRLIRRGDGTIYSPSHFIAWNHQLLPNFNKFRPKSREFHQVRGRSVDIPRENALQNVRLIRRSFPFSKHVNPITEEMSDSNQPNQETGTESQYDFEDE